ncbi:hypothetical protein CHGG_00982 [Chaetomium globosum CBS 148.51]|uniref:CAP-Gly domain-containing protein n=1 Tax=Chaetomium globosum (strain ATCC 6205 / CBS 148.51 / DSM 1962 / NBRC 6347 / NRRL 1970) TaxID=306901 RepID=Q2HFM2_CHAGB|nr:uncharacterized protein CHGG_00982 [Chaetomium globosum CBS 148.51]EAQ92747.1 hypothetical protein CHGG_00982 [Chaetomium globosum CBS 148.51]
MTSTTTTTSTYNTTTRHTLSRRPGRSGIATASTPNLNQLYTSQTSRLLPPALARKGSVAALTQNSLASIPDDSEGYAYHAYNSDLASDTIPPMPPHTPGRFGGGDEVAIGDTVDVPGNMTGTVRFIGSVAGRKGNFAGVELHPDYAPRGKNSGDVDGVYYFTTVQPGAGIFLPLSKAVKHESPAVTGNSFPITPASGGLKVANQNSLNFTSPTPGVPKFSQSVGPSRASSPLGKKTRPSLPRPESPVRRLMTPGPRPSITTPAPKTGAPKFGSPISANKFAQSVRGTTGDPNKRMLGHGRKGSVGPRSVSVLGTTSNPHYTDDDTTPMGIQRTQTNGSMGSASSFSLKVRPASRAMSRAGNHGNDEEVERLKTELENREQQLKEQAATLAEMETSLTELQGLIENSESHMGQRRNSIDDKDSGQLRALVREKNDKIAMLTAEFDAHRADFRSTIDTLEMASSETERVYEKRIEELMQEIQELQDRTADVDTVAAQLKQLEELVQELEEGLEDARRGEAEARGEVEFLRGEVERTRTELRREREKAQSSMNGPNGAANSGSMSKELEQKEDEIRGLKAIIHSLSRDSVPNDNSERTPTQRQSAIRAYQGESIEDRLTREKLDREVAELRALVESKTSREEDLERELESLRRGSVMTAVGPASHRASAMTIGSAANDRSSIRDSRGTVIAPPSIGSPEPQQHLGLAPLKHNRGTTLDTMPESDTYSTATENSTLWCEICETSGHDILTCTNVFGPDQQQRDDSSDNNDIGGARTQPIEESENEYHEAANIKPAPLSPIKSAKPTLPINSPVPTPTTAIAPTFASAPVPAPAPAPSAAPATSPGVRTVPNPMESGPVAGKDSGVVDASKWCALCERDGHDSVDCPFEDAF